MWNAGCWILDARYWIFKGIAIFYNKDGGPYPVSSFILIIRIQIILLFLEPLILVTTYKINQK